MSINFRESTGRGRSIELQGWQRVWVSRRRHRVVKWGGGGFYSNRSADRCCEANEAALKGSEISEVGDAEIGIYGDKIELLSGGISSANSANINLTGNKMDIRQAAVLQRSAHQGGGDINIKSRELNMKGAGIRTSSVDGQAGNVNIDVDQAMCTSLRSSRIITSGKTVGQNSKPGTST